MEDDNTEFLLMTVLMLGYLIYNDFKRNSLYSVVVVVAMEEEVVVVTGCGGRGGSAVLW